MSRIGEAEKPLQARRSKSHISARHTLHLIVYSGNMEAMRQSWTDDRLDDFRGEVNRRFDEVDKRFDEVDKRFEAVDKRFEAVDRRFDRVDKRIDDLGRRMDSRFDAQQHAMDARFDAVQGAIVQLQRTMFQAAVAVVVALITGAAAIAATQL